MIVTEIYELNGISMTKTYSDTRHYIERDGIKYDEAHDPTSKGRTYTESEDVIEMSYEDELEDARSALKVLGVEQ